MTKHARGHDLSNDADYHKLLTAAIAGRASDILYGALVFATKELPDFGPNFGGADDAEESKYSVHTVDSAGSSGGRRRRDTGVAIQL